MVVSIFNPSRVSRLVSLPCLASRVSRLAPSLRFASLVFCLLFFGLLFAETRDPTVPTAGMADLLKRDMGSSSELKLHALVVGAEGEGVALLGKTAKDAQIVRKGSVLTETIEGVRVSATVKSVTPAGVELASEGDQISGCETRDERRAPNNQTIKQSNNQTISRPLFFPGSFAPLAAPTNKVAELVRHLESEKVPIDRIMRLIADQTGVNISSSDAAAEKTVSIFLRNVTAEAAVEEICRATRLWFRRDPEGGVIRITTMAEYSENLSSFREETTKTFTLLYPNVVEIASVIYGLYPERTLVSLGEEEFQEDDEYDLSRRFRRFRVIEENGNSQFMEMQAPQSSSSGGRSGGGNFSFSRGSALSRLTQWDRLRERGKIGGRGQYSTPEAMLSAAAAKQLNAAAEAGDTNAFETVYQKNANGKANIFVTMSRKNNMLIVRTSDVKVMDEITRLVKELDVPTPMVLLELRVLELQLDDNFNAKFEWHFKGFGDTETERNVNYAGDLAAGAMSAFQPAFAFMLASKHIEADIEMLAQDGKIKTLATPTLLVANNEVSRIFSGKEYPLVTGWSAGSTVTSLGGTTTVDTVPEIEKKDIGTMLLITPNINADKTVTLRLLQENSDIGGKADIEVHAAATDESEGATAKRQIEYVESRSITGTFVSKDNATVMAGGLITEKESEQYYRTPVLGSIPWLGFLFRGTEKVKNRTEMIILIKPHVIMTPMEGGKISSELMRQLSDHPAADGRPNMGVFREGEDPTAKKHTLRDDLKAIVE